MELVKMFVAFLMNIVLWIWSHLPLACLSDDDNFATIEIEKIRKSHFRFSLFSIMIGDIIIYLVSYDFREHKLSMYKVLHLTDIDGNVLTDSRAVQIQDRFRQHIKDLPIDEMEIEKEKLIYHIDQENQRISTSVDKINMYTTIILTIVPLALALIDFKALSDLPKGIIILTSIATYLLFNICVFIFRIVKVSGIKKSSFSDLRQSDDKNKEIAIQYQYDWQQLKYKANLYVSIVSNIEDLIVALLILILAISVGIVTHNNIDDNTGTYTPVSKVYTLSKDEIGEPYSSSTIEWQKIILDIETKKCERLVILTRDMDVQNAINDLSKYIDLEVDIYIDDDMNYDILKILEEY